MRGRTPLFQHLNRAIQKARLSQKGIHAPRLKTPHLSRRQFLATSAGAALLGLYSRVSHAAPTTGPRVAVVGGGIAGLNCTRLLANAGFNVTLYEGASHTGGRIQTDHNSVVQGIYTEIGGEFIDTVHDDMLALAALFNLDLLDTFGCGEAGLDIAYYGGGKIRSEDEVIAALGPVAKAVDRDYNRTSDDITFDSHSQIDAKLDTTPLSEYFDHNVKTAWLYDILEAAYVNEFGLDLADQSSLNFITLFDTEYSDGLQVYGESDQRYKIDGGNQLIVDALAQTVQNRIVLNRKLKALTLKPDNTYQLDFDSSGIGRGGGSPAAIADIVVLCIPFTILRNITLNVPMPAVKRKAINELGYGTNGKLILGFDNRQWRDLGFAGDSYAGLPYQSGWDSSRLQGGTAGTYTIYPGGTQAVDLKSGTDLDQAKRLLPGLNKVFPGIKQHWQGSALRAYWPSNPFVKASYSAYKPGQWTSIRGAEPMPVGNLYFAGEHTSLDWQGYMNGGAQTGREVAEAIIGT